MEANLVRILLLIALFFLLSGDYSSFVKHLVPGFEDGDEDVAVEQPGAIGMPQPERGPEELQVKPTDENESTYKRSVRTVRGIQTSTEPPLNLAKADRELVRQLGPNFCVYEDVCLQHVRMAAAKNAPDWREIFDNFGQLAPSKQQYYLLSVFLGDIIRSEKLCQHFRETGRICH